jgi:mono/diheme cytochrome c family protein
MNLNPCSPFALLLLAATPCLAAGDEGKDLVDQNCYSCHGNEVYTRPDHKVQSLPGLRKQVQRCELALGLRWFDEQIDSSTAYLNRSFYKFK